MDFQWVDSWVLRELLRALLVVFAADSLVESEVCDLKVLPEDYCYHHFLAMDQRLLNSWSFHLRSPDFGSHSHHFVLLREANHGPQLVSPRYLMHRVETINSLFEATSCSPAGEVGRRQILSAESELNYA
jgi:hypothetical protein